MKIQISSMPFCPKNESIFHTVQKSMYGLDVAVMEHWADLCKTVAINYALALIDELHAGKGGRGDALSKFLYPEVQCRVVHDQAPLNPAIRRRLVFINVIL